MSLNKVLHSANANREIYSIPHFCILLSSLLFSLVSEREISWQLLVFIHLEKTLKSVFVSWLIPDPIIIGRKSSGKIDGTS